MKFLLIALLAVMTGQGALERGDTLLAVSWNLENFFDWRNDTLNVSDAGFSSRGEKRWTRKRFLSKCDLVSKALFYIASKEGSLPDIIAFQEVENYFVLRQLLSKTLLRKAFYGIVHKDSPDPRGIDVAILYRKDRLELLSYRAARIDSFRTRDILEAGFAFRAHPGNFSFIACHLPSKYGGEKESFPKRQTAARALAAVIDSVVSCGRMAIAAGDFNDTPSSQALMVLEEGAENISRNWLGSVPCGTIRFEGRWEVIDMFLISRNVDAQILQSGPCVIPFLMTRDASHPGSRPLRTYSGPRYLGGVSDHLPVVLKLVLTCPSVSGRRGPQNQQEEGGG